MTKKEGPGRAPVRRKVVLDRTPSVSGFAYATKN